MGRKMNAKQLRAHRARHTNPTEMCEVIVVVVEDSIDDVIDNMTAQMDDHYRESDAGYSRASTLAGAHTVYGPRRESWRSDTPKSVFHNPVITRFVTDPREIR